MKENVSQSGSAGADLEARFKKISLLVMDVDGVLTDGRMYYDSYGDPLKAFDVQDGYGMLLWHSVAGNQSAIVTALKSRLVKQRARHMKIGKLYMGIRRKGKIFHGLCRSFHVKAEQVCFVGDDLLDIPLMTQVGLAVAVANAHPETKRVAHYCTQNRGGRGAVRELTEKLLQAQGHWDEVLRKFAGL